MAWAMSYDITREIQDLKKKKGAVILSHFYEYGEIQDIADHVGDSFFLANQGQLCKEKIILLAGVVFMAESVKILNPEKTVLVPDLNAGCSLVKGSPFDQYLAWRNQYPNGVLVTYINSSAEVKSISDVIVTSSNAKKIIDSIPKDRPILFGPDKNLGHFLSRQTGREFVLWDSVCEVHALFSAKRLHEFMELHPDAKVIAHPECDPQVLQYAEVVGSTSLLLDEVINGSAKKYIVATETGIFHQMKKARPDVVLIQAPVEDKSCACNNCPYMKMNTLEKIRMALETLKPEVKVAENLRLKAQISLQRMMDIAQNRPVEWPQRFSI